MTSIRNIDVVVVMVAVFVVVMVLARIHVLFERRATKEAGGEPPVTTTDPYRRNQSVISAKPPAGRTGFQAGNFLSRKIPD
jgi:hypothetical protein